MSDLDEFNDLLGRDATFERKVESYDDDALWNLLCTRFDELFPEESDASFWDWLESVEKEFIEQGSTEAAARLTAFLDDE
jgi:hypothetical protein